jgi:hypothetical protein
MAGYRRSPLSVTAPYGARRPLCWLVFPFILCAAWPNPAPGQSRRLIQARARELVERARRSAASIPDVLKSYDRIEARKRLGLEDRYALHRDLLEAIGEQRTTAMVQFAGEILLRPSKKEYASQVLMLKVVAKDDFPAPRSKRVEWLVRFLKDSHVPFSIWACRLLGDTHWRESVDALIDVMALEENEHRSGGGLWNLASGELYRVLGSSAYSVTAASIRREWDRLGQKVPEPPRYSLATHGGGRTTTMGFFGDKISSRSVFVIDRSSSMRGPVTLKHNLGMSVTSVAGAKGDDGESKRATGKKPAGTVETTEIPRERKIDIVRKELLRALDRLQRDFRFNIVSFDAAYEIWGARVGRTGRKSKSRTVSPAALRRRARASKLRDLYPASPRNVTSARNFALRLSTGKGTNIYDAIEVALGFRGVDTIYLLSDGSPSRGGTAPEIEKSIRLRNYLQGVRIITYGFASERGEDFDEAFMQRLARDNWGWYRRLNRL